MPSTPQVHASRITRRSLLPPCSHLVEVPPLPSRGDGLVEVELRVVGALLLLVAQRLIGALDGNEHLIPVPATRLVGVVQQQRLAVCTPSHQKSRQDDEMERKRKTNKAVE